MDAHQAVEDTWSMVFPDRVLPATLRRPERRRARRPVERVQLTLLAFAVLNAFGCVPSLLRADQPLVLRAGLALAVAGLALYWVRGYSARDFPPAGELIEAAVICGCAVVIRGGQVLGLFYLGLFFRSMYGSTGRAVVRTGLYATALVVAAALGPVFDPAQVIGETVGLIAVSAAMQVCVQAQRELADLAYRDPLTGLSNHRAFHEHLASVVDAAAGTGGQVALAAFDLDHFKLLNDTHGHPKGDEVLRRAAHALKDTVARAGGHVGRVGGEEFMALFAGVDRANVLAAVEAARVAVGDATPRGLEVRCSAGVALFPEHAGSLPGLLEFVDAALYWAKESGRDQTRIYDPAEITSGSATALAEEVLLLLSEPSRVRPVFQPIVSLESATVVGYEALTRFEHPVSRTPIGWFHAARRAGLGPQLEALAISRALACPDRPGSTFLSLNLSPTALLSRHVEEALPADLSGLVIEITEQESLPADAALERRLRQFRARGAQIALDDAGAGYAGLQAVMRIAPDVIKLDRTLITGLAADPARLALVEALARFADSTDSTLCAEGIETIEDRETLCRLGVELGQGYFFARPAPHWVHILPGARVAGAQPADARAA